MNSYRVGHGEGEVPLDDTVVLAAVRPLDRLHARHRFDLGATLLPLLAIPVVVTPTIDAFARSSISASPPIFRSPTPTRLC